MKFKILTERTWVPGNIKNNKPKGISFKPEQKKEISIFDLLPDKLEVTIEFKDVDDNIDDCIWLTFLKGSEQPTVINSSCYTLSSDTVPPANMFDKFNPFKLAVRADYLNDYAGKDPYSCAVMSRYVYPDIMKWEGAKVYIEEKYACENKDGHNECFDLVEPNFIQLQSNSLCPATVNATSTSLHNNLVGFCFLIREIAFQLMVVHEIANKDINNRVEQINNGE